MQAMGLVATFGNKFGPCWPLDAMPATDRMLRDVLSGITPERAREVAETGVDVLSLGWLTHSVRALDVGLDVLPVNRVA